MEHWWVYLLFAATCAICALLTTKTNRKYMNYYENNMTKAPNTDKEDSPRDIWKKEGCSRSFENAEYTLPEEDFFEDEKTELPKTEEELFSGLSEEEKRSILKEAGLLEDEDGREQK